MNIIDRAAFTKFLQELVFSFYYGIAAFIKAIICKTSHAFFPLIFPLNNFKDA
jgi:hypothetical protein